MASPIVDSQVHLHTAGTPGAFFLQRPFLAEELLQLMAEAGVDRALLIPPTWDPNGNVPSLYAARKYPDRFAVMGRIDISEPDGPARIRDWKKQKGMLGVRIVLNAFPIEVWRKGGSAEWFWAAAEEAGVPVMMHVGHHRDQVEFFADVAARHPGLRMVVDHLGARITNAGKDDVAFDHLPVILDLARLPNVAVKASGIPTYSSEPYPYARLHVYLRRVYDTFGPERMFWGTDLTRSTYWDRPETPKRATYRQAVTLFTEELSWFSPRDRELIMGVALCNWIGWPL